MPFNYKAQYQRYLEIFENELKSALTKIDAPETLKESMKYAVLDGGKRVRPILALATAEMLEVDLSLILPYTVAIESIHSYSLVHDDLPSMDNDDYRRGKLSTHKKFGEAQGILAGDALLNFAFEYVLNKENFTLNDSRSLALLAKYSGSSGMVGGQVLDLKNEKNCEVSEQTLYEIYKNKTAKLIMAPILIASILNNNRHFDTLYEYGLNLGYLFQISDDILDIEGTIENLGKTPHKDENSDKLSAIKVFGLDGAKQRKLFHYNKCVEQLNMIKNNEFLLALTKNMFERTKWYEIR